jgi:hypothetical protein
MEVKMNRLIQMAVVLLAVACGSSAKLSLSARAGTSVASAAAASPTALTLPNGIVVSRVRVVISELKLETANSAAAAEVAAAATTAADGGSAEAEGEDEIEAGPILLDLSGTALDGTVQKVLDAAFKPGTYSEIRFKIHQVTAAESTDAALKAMSDAGASIIVDGTIDGATFSFVSSLEAQQKSEGTLDLTADDNLTLNVDETNWFGTGTARLDPRVAANRSQIENTIKSSFRAFRDNNRDGHDD